VGTTVFHTLAGVLLLLLASPIYDGARIYYASKETTEQTSLELRWGVGECGLPVPALSFFSLWAAGLARLRGLAPQPAEPAQPAAAAQPPERPAPPPSLAQTCSALHPTAVPLTPACPLREHEAHTLLSFTLTASCVALMFLVRKLGRVLGQMDRMSVSEAAMLKQVGACAG
jgi:hypothetical protein